MTVTPITSYDHFKQVTSSGKPVVIDFWATWCGPCRIISPIFEKFSDNAEYANVEFYKVDVDELADVAEEAGVTAMPTFVAFKGGVKFSNAVIGAKPQDIQKLISVTAN